MPRHGDLGLRLREAVKAFKISLTLSILGTVVEGIVVFFVSRNMILLTDLVHWFVDTWLEALLLISIVYASRSTRRFPFGAIILESSLMIVIVMIISVIYGYVFVDYINYFIQNPGISIDVDPLLSFITAFGGMITGLLFIIQRRYYMRLRVELLKVDLTHALIDMVASIIATSGILIVSSTRNFGVEVAFTMILTFFVIHSAFEILEDAFRAILGKNIDIDMKLRILDRVMNAFGDIKVKNIDVRKYGSFYVVAINVLVDPKMSIMDAYRMRSKLINRIREESDLIYHVDVVLTPDFTRNQYRRRKH
ncbi:MAG: cation transporter [Desulfurococcaceae archaeon]